MENAYGAMCGRLVGVHRTTRAFIICRTACSVWQRDQGCEECTAIIVQALEVEVPEKLEKATRPTETVFTCVVVLLSVNLLIDLVLVIKEE